ncbi:MAG: exosortase [Colwellia sp.]
MTENKFNTHLFFNRTFIAVLLLLSLVSLLNFPILITLWQHGFDDGTYSHAFLIPFISIYLYFLVARVGKLQFRKDIALSPVILLFISSYLLFITTNAQISIGYWLSLLAVLVSSIIVLFKFNLYVIFPTTFFIFLIPLWGVLVPLLQKISVIVVTFIMSFTGVPTFVEGEIITIPAGVFEIADGCSGLRYIIVSLAISSLFIFLNIRNTKKAILFLLITVLGALLTNWVRITALILIGEYTNMESSLMEDHNTFGWYLYIPFMVLLFFLGNRLSEINIFDNVAIKQKQHFPNITALLLLIIPITFSSTYLQMQFKKPQQNANKIESHPNFEHHPIIYSYSSVEIVKFNEDEQKITYYFDGSELDGKPSFYGNSLIPQGWNVIEESKTPYEKIFIIKKFDKVAKLIISFETNNHNYSTIAALKIARIRYALFGGHDSKLHWHMKYCSNRCTINI